RVAGDEAVPFAGGPAQHDAFLDRLAVGGIGGAPHGPGNAEDLAGDHVPHHDLFAVRGGLDDFQVPVQQDEEVLGRLALPEYVIARIQAHGLGDFENRVEIFVGDGPELVQVLDQGAGYVGTHLRIRLC